MASEFDILKQYGATPSESDILSKYGATPTGRDTNPAVTKAKLQSMYPEQLGDQEPASSRFLSNFAQGMNPLPAISKAVGWDRMKQSWDAMQQGDYGSAAMGVLSNAVEGPQRIASDILGAHGNQLKQAYQYARAGRPSEAIGHAGAAFLPVIGPAAASLTEQAAGEPSAPNQVGPTRRPDVAGAAGGATAFGTQALLGAAIPAAGRLPSRVGQFIDNQAIRSTHPIEGQIQAIRPRSKWITAREDIAAASPDIKAGEAAMGHKIGELEGTPDNYPGATTQDYIKAVRTQKNAIWDQVKRAEAASAERGTIMNHSNAADAATASIPETIRLSDPDKAMAMGKANDWLRQDFDVPTTEKLIQEANARLDSYYGENPAAARSTALTNPATAKDAAMVDQLRQNLYSKLEEQTPGGNPTVRQLKQRYGKLSRVEDSALARLPVAMRQAPNSLAQQIAGMESAGNVARGGIKLAGGIMSGHGGIALSGLGDMASALVEPKVAQWIKEGQTTDTLLRRAMANHPGGAADITIPPPIPQQNPSRLLPPGPIRMPGVPDPSGPIAPTLPMRPDLGPYWYRGAERQLPAATSGIGVSGTIAPDILGTSRRGTGTGAQGLLAAPAPGQPATRVQPAGAVGVENAIGPAAGNVLRNSTETPIPLPAAGSSLPQSVGGEMRGMRGMQFYSPNVEENLNLDQARAASRSAEHQAFIADGKKIDEQEIGMKSNPRSAMGFWKDGAENSVFNEVDGTPEQNDYSAARKGKVGRQKGVITFNVDSTGPDSLHRFKMPGSAEEAERALTGAGIEYKTMVEEPDGVQIVVYDKGSGLQPNLERLADTHDLREFNTRRGNGRYIGGDTREEGAAAFDAVIADYEARLHGQVGRGPGQGSQGLSNYRGSPAAPQPAAVVPSATSFLPPRQYARGGIIGDVRRLSRPHLPPRISLQ